MGESSERRSRISKANGIEISVIIPVFGDKHEENLKGVLFCLNRQTFRNFETIIVTDKIRNHYNKVSFCLAVDPNSKLMNKNWMFNVGANKSNGRKLVFLDADMCFHEDYLQKIKESKLKWTIGWNKCVYLNDGSSSRIRNFEMIEFYSDNATGVSSCGACGGSQVFDRRFFFEKFYGHNENYYGWGGEDNDSTLRASTLVGSHNTIEYCIGHLNHERIGYHSKNNSDNWWTTEHNTNEITKRIGINRKKGLVGNTGGPNHIFIGDLH